MTTSHERVIKISSKKFTAFLFFLVQIQWLDNFRIVCKRKTKFDLCERERERESKKVRVCVRKQKIERKRDRKKERKKER